MSGRLKIGAWMRLAGLFFRELAVSVKDVLVMVLDPRIPIRSAIVAVPLAPPTDGKW